MADLLLSVVEALLRKLTSQALAAYARINGLSEQITKWQKNLVIIQAVMDSAEERRMLGDTKVYDWLDDLREVAYDMEDLLELFFVEDQSKAPVARTRRTPAKFISFLIPSCSKMDPRVLLSYHRFAKEIEELDRRLEEVIRQKSLLSLAENYVARPPANLDRPRRHTTSLPNPRFVGREEQMEKLLARLTGSDSADDPVRPFTVVSIVGMGGLGKTSLAQKLYNHEDVMRAFPVRTWTCVSDVFDIVAITKSILQAVHPQIDCKQRDLNWLQNELKDELAGKKFLIMLDDVWSENDDELESLLNPFHSGNSGSRILLTTRIRRVAKLVGDPDPIALDLLSTDECLSLLACHAIGEESFENQPRLKDIAIQLAEKCGRLPLAVKTIGRLLCSEGNDMKWNEVLEHSIWKRQGKNDGIHPALQLSYIHLPIHLKQCFAACAIFPKDYLFCKDELIHLWIGQGLLQRGTAGTYYDTGIDYFDELEARSLLQKTKEDESFYYMHDLVNDLAKSVSGIKCYPTYEYEVRSNKEYQEKVRWAALHTQSVKYLVSTEVDVYRSMKKLRAFVSLNRHYRSDGTVRVSHKVLHDLIMGLERLRMLSLRGFHVTELPDHIGDLKLLRFINFSSTFIEVLPESICGLNNLESLILQDCKVLQALPRNIHKLSKLIHLDITGSYRIEEMPPHIGRLTNLEILPCFVVGKEIGHGLKELGPLEHIAGKLHIRNLHLVNEVGDAKDANMSEKNGIRDLSFHWEDGDVDDEWDEEGDDEGILREEEHQLKILDHLQPPRRIEHLEILFYGGKMFPSWLGNPHMDKLTTITLKDCRNVESLPSLGKLSSLKRLEIKNLNALSSIGDEFFGTDKPFPSLLRLEFMNMPVWERWSYREDSPEDEKPFPQLQELVICYCPRLKRGLPSRLDELSELTIRGCPLLETSGDSLSLPSLRSMDISNDIHSGLLNCLVTLTSLIKLKISWVPQPVRLERKFLSSCVSLEKIKIDHCEQFVDGDFGKEVLPKLRSFRIYSCHGLEKLPGDLGCLPSLINLTVDDCGKLSSFPSSGFPPTLRDLSLHGCSSLPLSQFRSVKLPQSIKSLSLWDVGKFTFALPECWLPAHLEELKLHYLEGLTSITDAIAGGNCTRSLRLLEIDSCESMMTLPDCLRHLSCLSYLTVSNCPALELDCFPNLPDSLSEFHLSDCPKVRSLPDCLRHLSRLSKLWLFDCPALELDCFPNLPKSLSEFHLSRCPKVRSLPDCLKHLSRLSNLWVSDCPALELDFSNLPSSLSEFNLGNCREVKFLADDMRKLTSIKSLTFSRCHALTGFPRGGLPPNLDSLHLENCKNLNQPLEEWGLGDLRALRELKIEGKMGCMDEAGCFPSSASDTAAWSRALPSSLVELEISDTELKRLAGGLRHHLTSLRDLSLINCEKMRFLPEEGLPDSLESFYIRSCPLLEKRCSEEWNGEYWPLLQLVPVVDIVEKDSTMEGYGYPSSDDSVL